MKHSNIFHEKGRIPIIPIPKELDHLRINGEIIVDETNKKIFLTDRTDRSIMHDLSDWIINDINNGTNEDGDIITIDEVINIINERTLEAVDITDFNFQSENGDIDNISIKKYRNKIEIAGFYEAQDNTIPVKINNKIVWVNIKNISQNGSIGSGSENDHVGDLNKPQDDDSSIDRAYGNVYQIEPNNDILYLIISRRQQSRLLTGNKLVVLPKSIYEYINIEWVFFTGNSPLNLEYQNNIFFDTSEYNRFKKNTRYKIEFTSHDKGISWIGKITEFSNQYIGGDS